MTRPTTIKAMTDTPAKTPRPIGNTLSLVPGSWKLVEEESAAAEVPVDDEDPDEVVPGVDVGV